MIPSFTEIEKLHHKYAPTEKLFQLVFTHSQIIWEIAEEIIEKKQLAVNKDFIQTAALLHDIGAYELIGDTYDAKKYIKHGVIGYDILKIEGLDDTLCEIARRHTGVGITKAEIEMNQLPLPPMDYVARTIEERLLMYADKFHSKDPTFNSYAWYENFVKRFGEESVDKFQKLAEEFGIPDLDGLAKKYNHPIR